MDIPYSDTLYCFLTSLAVPQEVDSYHGLCPIEPLDTPTDQVSEITFSLKFLLWVPNDPFSECL